MLKQYYVLNEVTERLVTKSKTRVLSTNMVFVMHPSLSSTAELSFRNTRHFLAVSRTLRHVISPPGRRAARVPFTETWSPFNDLFFASIVGPPENMICLIPLSLADFESYVIHSQSENRRSSTNFIVSDCIAERNTKHSSVHRSLSNFEPVEKANGYC